MEWSVIIPKKVRKQVDKLPPAIYETFYLLVAALKTDGPEAKGWHHFGRLVTSKREPDMYHCHLNKGAPRYVAVWRVEDQTVEMMEMRYVGTHEGADYKRIR